MKTNVLMILIIPICQLFGFFVLQSPAQDLPPAFRMNLSRGYRLKMIQGTDTRGGEISKPGGLLIRFDMAGDLPAKEERRIKPTREWKRKCAWNNNEHAEGKYATGDVNCWIDVDEEKHQKILHVAFPDLTQFWTRVKNQRQIDEALQMLLTYDPDTQPRETNH